MNEQIYSKVTEKQTPAKPLPGDRVLTPEVEEMIRVDHAGEFGAVRIYAGQAAVFGKNHHLSPLIKHMAEQEDVHLEHFNKMIAERGVRPTILSPFWHVAGFALGAGTALMGEKAAMACTAAVETVIDDHYQEQLDKLEAENAEPELVDTIKKFQAEEVEHREIAKKHGAEEATAYPLLSQTIMAGCKAAIWLSKKI